MDRANCLPCPCCPFPVPVAPTQYSLPCPCCSNPIECRARAAPVPVSLSLLSLLLQPNRMPRPCRALPRAAPCRARYSTPIARLARLCAGCSTPTTRDVVAISPSLTAFVANRASGPVLLCLFLEPLYALGYTVTVLSADNFLRRIIGRPVFIVPQPNAEARGLRGGLNIPGGQLRKTPCRAS
jgi:hypothetical protein